MAVRRSTYSPSQIHEEVFVLNLDLLTDIPFVSIALFEYEL